EYRLAQSLGPPAGNRGEIRTQAAPAAVDLMTGGAPALTEEDTFSSGRVAGNFLSGHGPAEAADIAYKLPDLVGEHFESRHLGTGNTLVDILIDLSILAAVKKVSSRERRPPPAASIAAMT